MGRTERMDPSNSSGAEWGISGPGVSIDVSTSKLAKPILRFSFAVNRGFHLASQ
jgi:hypothetical protein